MEGADVMTDLSREVFRVERQNFTFASAERKKTGRQPIIVGSESFTQVEEADVFSR